MHRRSGTLAALILSVGFPAALAAQSLNVDFGSAGSAPAPTYDAAGSPGIWNSVGVLVPFARVPMVNADGAMTGVELYMFGGTQILNVDVAGTHADDAALVDDMLIGFNDPVDVCIWVDGLVNDSYEVLIYALTPGNPSLASRTRVDFESTVPQEVGGEWPGTHLQGITFGRHTVTIVNGRIGLHAGIYGGLIQSGINGIQIRPRSPSAAPDLHGTRVLGVHPNPGRASQRIEFSLEVSSRVTVEIIDIAGRIVWRQPFAHPPGRHAVEWRGTDTAGRPLPASVYFVRLRAAHDVTATHKLLRLN